MAISSNLSRSDKRLIKCNPGIGIPRRKIAGFCRRHHIRKLSLFGSVLRDDFGPDSDVDVLVEFLPGHTPGYFSLFDMETEFSALLGGRKADIRTSQDLSRYFREQVIREARVQYEAAG
ncbi:MAG: nucleotidyltransferase family protein [Chloroflexi bacterium]|nr:nucleotidyltransferase family protein [Chloroflexota bacterium]